MLNTNQAYLPVQKNIFPKIIILKSLMYCGALWGLFHEGWAMLRDQEEVIFPLWLNPIHAQTYAEKHWPNYTPTKITPDDFNQALVPTLTRLNLSPALFDTGTKLKVTIAQLQQFIFSSQRLHFA